MKYSTVKSLYEILSYDFVSIRYMSRKTSLSYQYIWNCIKFMRALNLLIIEKSPLDSSIKVYKLKPINFNEFMEIINE